MSRRVNWPALQGRAALFFGLALLFVVGVLTVRAFGEGDRTQAAVTAAITAEQERQAAEQRRQAAEQERQGAALCASWKVQAEADVTPATTEIGRSLVRTSADAYRLTKCEQRTGPLEPGKPDPEAYRPAPPPAGGAR